MLKRDLIMNLKNGYKANRFGVVGRKLKFRSVVLGAFLILSFDFSTSAAHALKIMTMDAPGLKTLQELLSLVQLRAEEGPASSPVEYFDYKSFAANAKSLTIITFDDLNRGNGVLNGKEYVSKGLRITERSGSPINVFSAKDSGYFYPTNFNSQPNGISSSSGVNFDCPGCSDSFDFVLSTPATAAGLWIGNLNGSTEVQFLASDGSVIASEVLDENHKGVISNGAALWDNRVFYGVTSNQPIARIRTTNPASDGDGVVYDDIQFGSANRPQSITVKPKNDRKRGRPLRR